MYVARVRRYQHLPHSTSLASATTSTTQHIVSFNTRIIYRRNTRIRLLMPQLLPTINSTVIYLLNMTLVLMFILFTNIIFIINLVLLVRLLGVIISVLELSRVLLSFATINQHQSIKSDHFLKNVIRAE